MQSFESEYKLCGEWNGQFENAWMLEYTRDDAPVAAVQPYSLRDVPLKHAERENCQARLGARRFICTALLTSEGHVDCVRLRGGQSRELPHAQPPGVKVRPRGSSLQTRNMGQSFRQRRRARRHVQ
eukprot:scaffold27062_cov36-Prasinocladus_malaysianus.AAC.2